MFTRNHAKRQEAVASDMKAYGGRHARSGQRAARPLRGEVCQGSSDMVYADGAYAMFGPSACREARQGADAACQANARRKQEPLNEPSHAGDTSDAISSEELERKFQDFFRMGAVVAIGELFDEGLLGNKAQAASVVRDYLISFGVDSLDSIRALGVTGPYLEDFAGIFCGIESLPPAA